MGDVGRTQAYFVLRVSYLSTSHGQFKLLFLFGEFVNIIDCVETGAPCLKLFIVDSAVIRQSAGSLQQGRMADAVLVNPVSSWDVSLVFSAGSDGCRS